MGGPKCHWGPGEYEECFNMEVSYYKDVYSPITLEYEEGNVPGCKCTWNNYTSKELCDGLDVASCLSPATRDANGHLLCLWGPIDIQECKDMAI